MQYTGEQPRVFLMSLDTGQKEMVGNFPGMTFAPRFAPDGQRLVMSIGEGGATGIADMDLRSRQTRRLTNSSGIDTGPCYSPDGRRIVFESDREGGQQLHVMNADGSGARRISYGDGRYATPVWSPRGDLIAFTKQTSGSFLIGVMRTDGSGERILTEGYPQRGANLVPQWPRDSVLPREPGRKRWSEALFHRPDRLQRAAGADAVLRVRSGLVSVAKLNAALPRFNPSGVSWKVSEARLHRRACTQPLYRVLACRCALNGSGISASTAVQNPRISSCVLDLSVTHR